MQPNALHFLFAIYNVRTDLIWPSCQPNWIFNWSMHWYQNSTCLLPLSKKYQMEKLKHSWFFGFCAQFGWTIAIRFEFNFLLKNLSFLLRHFSLVCGPTKMLVTHGSHFAFQMMEKCLIYAARNYCHSWNSLPKKKYWTAHKCIICWIM